MPNPRPKTRAEWIEDSYRSRYGSPSGAQQKQGQSPTRRAAERAVGGLSTPESQSFVQDYLHGTPAPLFAPRKQQETMSGFPEPFLHSLEGHQYLASPEGQENTAKITRSRVAQEESDARTLKARGDVLNTSLLPLGTVGMIAQKGLSGLTFGYSDRALEQIPGYEENVKPYLTSGNANIDKYVGGGAEIAGGLTAFSKIGMAARAVGLTGAAQGAATFGTGALLSNTLQLERKNEEVTGLEEGHMISPEQAEKLRSDATFDAATGIVSQTALGALLPGATQAAGAHFEGGAISQAAARGGAGALAAMTIGATEAKLKGEEYDNAASDAIMFGAGEAINAFGHATPRDVAPIEQTDVLDVDVRETAPEEVDLKVNTNEVNANEPVEGRSDAGRGIEQYEPAPRRVSDIGQDRTNDTEGSGARVPDRQSDLGEQSGVAPVEAGSEAAGEPVAGESVDAYRTTYHEPIEGLAEGHQAFTPGKLVGYEEAPLVVRATKTGKNKGRETVGVVVPTKEEARAATGVREIKHDDGYFVPIDYVRRPEGETVEKTAEGPAAKTTPTKAARETAAPVVRPKFTIPGETEFVIPEGTKVKAYDIDGAVKQTGAVTDSRIVGKRQFYKIEGSDEWHVEDLVRLSTEASPVAAALESGKPLTPKQIVNAFEPKTIEEATLQYLAQGNGFNREDVRAAVGKNLKGGRNGDFDLNFWKLHTRRSPRIDYFIHEVLRERLNRGGASIHENQVDFDEINARNEVMNLLGDVRNQKQAREKLIDLHHERYDADINKEFEAIYGTGDIEPEAAARAAARQSDQIEKSEAGLQALEDQTAALEAQAAEGHDVSQDAQAAEDEVFRFFDDMKNSGAGTLRSTVIPFQPQLEQIAKVFGRDAAEVYSKDVGPKLRNAALSLRELSGQVRDVMAPSSNKGAKEFKGVMREKPAQLALDTVRIQTAFEESAEAMDKMPKAFTRTFIDKMEHGERQATPELEETARTLRVLRDEWVKKVQDLGTGKLSQLIDNYFPHIWKDPNAAEKALTAFYGKRPFEGDKSFLKKRTIDYVEDGLSLGLELVTENPVELMLLKVHQMQKYVMAHEVLNEAKSMGLVKFTRKASPDSGHSFIEDRGVGYVYGNPKQPVGPEVQKILKDNPSIARGMDDSALEMLLHAASNAETDAHGMVVVGRYQMPTEAARLINNYLSPGLRYKSGAFRGYLALANHMNQFQLGWSFFHLGFTTMDAVTSRLALGVYQIAHGDPIEAVKSIASAPAAPFTQWIEGNKIYKESMRPGTQGAIYADMVEALVKAGGRTKMDIIYKTDARKNLKRVWNETVGPLAKIVRTSVRLPAALTEEVASWVLEGIVPKTKLGCFAQLAKYDLERLGPNASVEQVRETLGKAWDSVDNRLGQLVYDNLFWDKAVKDLAMASVRSVGWNLGTFRELGGGAIDFARFGKDALTRNKQAEFTHRMSYVIALPVVAGLMGAITQYALTGKGPEELKDYFFPKDGGVDEAGSATRVSLPTYMKDVYAYYNDFKTGHTGRTLAHKLHPAIAAVSEMLDNKDYYGTEIVNGDDPLTQQMIDYAQFGLKQFVPFAAQGVHRSIQLDGLSLKSIGPFIGVVPAPRDVDRTPDELVLAQAREASRPVGSRTKRESERAQAKFELARTYRQDETEGEAKANALVEQSILSPLDAQRVLKSSGIPRYVRDFNASKIEIAIAAYEAASPERRAEYLPILEKKLRTAFQHANNLTDERRLRLENAAKRIETLPVVGE